MAHRIAIIGGGASGLICAARMAYLARKRGMQPEIVVFEKDGKVGRPILRSGNGRCNLTNASIDMSLYHNASFAEAVFVAAERACDDERSLMGAAHGRGNGGTRVPPVDEIFFANRGLLFREESEGRVYPYPNKASVVLDVLLRALRAGDVKTEVGACVEKLVARPSDAWGDGDAGHRFALHLEDSRVEHFDRVVVAVGGEVAELLLAEIPEERLARTPEVPLLCPLAVNSKAMKKLDNIRVKCVATLERSGEPVATERGEVLFRKYGVSGIAIFNLSRWAAPGDTLSLDLAPDTDEGDLVALMAERAASYEMAFGKRPTNSQALEGMLLSMVGDEVLRAAGIEPEGAFADAASVVRAVKRFAMSVTGTAETDKAQVHRGGIDPGSIDAETLEVKAVPGLYVTGEALDVDGPCGGYNLHFAWMSGLLAASSMIAQ